MSWLDGLAADNPGLVRLTEMGRSHEGRRIVVARVGRSPRGADTRAGTITQSLANKCVNVQICSLCPTRDVSV